MTASVSSSVQELREVVRHYRVCWEVWPESIWMQNHSRQIGYQLELYGTHEAGVEHVSPGCPACQQLYVALRAVAEWILPKERRPSTYEIGAYDQAIRYSPARRNRPDVTVRIRILHREDFESPVDACEVRCLQEMQEHLRELGAQGRQWVSEHKR